MSTRRALLGSLAVAAALVTGCQPSASGPSGNTNSLPDGAQLLTKSAATMRTVDTAHFTIKVDGELPGISVQNAEGDLTRAGTAKGSGKIRELGQLVQVDFVLTADSLYLKGPTGGFQQLPASLTSTIYDPSAILNPDKGVAKVLGSVQGGKTESVDTVGGVEVYVVSGKVPRDVVSGLVPGITTDVTGKLSVTKDDKAQLLRAHFDVPGKDGKSSGVDVNLSDLNKPVTINAPS
ncbi:LppX_LprAFG lipoprotein [Solihabitans fulvus]|uniref:LppX_LprAFG lipoprotein n=1 Tax=Solihabitans fulvus TaxID=1892852 RepID=A0A5B2W725_9PSEU|nr:LppX_LprAFG lipoprotein [Solihabitans fulvus]KAA2246009.1 LppX_LprAFG lipoprotein [Solihabitans fulvus]